MCSWWRRSTCVSFILCLFFAGDTLWRMNFAFHLFFNPNSTSQFSGDKCASKPTIFIFWQQQQQQTTHKKVQNKWVINTCLLKDKMMTVLLYNPFFVRAYLTTSLVSSTLCFILYGYDKFQAKRQGWRVAEQTLHHLEVLGGWPGSYVAQSLFHHKTKKEIHWISFLILVLNLSFKFF